MPAPDRRAEGAITASPGFSGKGYLGAVLTSALTAVALALALLQAAVIAHGAPRYSSPSAARIETNRFSVPGGRSGVPYLPAFDKTPPPEGRSREQQQEQHRTPPPPSRFRGAPPRPGPQPARRIAA